MRRKGKNTCDITKNNTTLVNAKDPTTAKFEQNKQMQMKQKKIT